MRGKGFTTALAILALPAFAQEQPLSAIDWLSVAEPETGTGIPVTGLGDSGTTLAALPEIEATPLAAPGLGGVGLLPVSVTGLPRALWQGSDEITLGNMIARASRDGPAVPALGALFHTLLLAEATPPAGGAGDRLLLARIDALLADGMVDQAQALVDRAGVHSPELFRRAFDLALLTGSDEDICTTLRENPRFSSDAATRIWCLARGGEYSRAVTIFQTADALGDLRTMDRELLVRFLDPAYAETAPHMSPPVRPTPLQVRLFEAIGEPLPTAALPLPFASIELAGDVGWKAQLEAAERLARAGAIPSIRLLGLYTQRKPAASGGVWDRVAAVQALDEALQSGDARRVGPALQKLWPQMRSAGLLVPLAELFAPGLAPLPLTGRAAELATKARLLSPDYQSAEPGPDASDALRFLAGIAKGRAPDTAPAGLRHAAALRAAWSTPPTSTPEMARMARENRIGELLLQALGLFHSGAQGNRNDLVRAIGILRTNGLEDTARRAALELAILDLEGARN